MGSCFLQKKPQNYFFLLSIRNSSISHSKRLESFNRHLWLEQHCWKLSVVLENYSKMRDDMQTKLLWFWDNWQWAIARCRLKVVGGWLSSRFILTRRICQRRQSLSKWCFNFWHLFVYKKLIKYVWNVKGYAFGFWKHYNTILLILLLNLMYKDNWIIDL